MHNQGNIIFIVIQSYRVQCLCVSVMNGNEHSSAQPERTTVVIAYEEEKQKKLLNHSHCTTVEEWWLIGRAVNQYSH